MWQCSASSRSLRADDGDANAGGDAPDSLWTCDTAYACIPPSAIACAKFDAGFFRAPCRAVRPLPPNRLGIACELCRTFGEDKC